MRKICYVSSRLCKNAKKSFMYIKNSENTHFGQFSNDTLLFYANRNKAEPREVTKQVVWIILRNRIFHRTIRHIRSGFPSYARTLCAQTLFAYALNDIFSSKIICILLDLNLGRKITSPEYLIVYLLHHGATCICKAVYIVLLYMFFQSFVRHCHKQVVL